MFFARLYLSPNSKLMFSKFLVRVSLFALYLITITAFVAEDLLITGASYGDDNFISDGGQHIPSDFFRHRDMNIVRYPIYSQFVDNNGSSTYSHRYAYLVWKTGDCYASDIGGMRSENEKIAVDSISRHADFMRERFDHFFTPLLNAKMIEDNWQRAGDTLLRQSRFSQPDCNPKAFTFTTKYMATKGVKTPSLISIIDTVPNLEICAVTISFDCYDASKKEYFPLHTTYWKTPTTIPLKTADSLYQLVNK